MLSRRPQLGSILMQMGAIDQMQLSSGLAQQRQWGKPLGQVLLEKHFCTAEQVFEALVMQLGMSAVELDSESPALEAVRLVSRKVAEQFHVVPLRLEGKRKESLVAAFAAPAALDALDAVASVSGKRVVPLLAPDEAIERALDQVYRGRGPTRRPVTPPMQVPVVQTVDAHSVLLYGWSDNAARSLALSLGSEGIPVRTVSAEQVRTAGGDAVVIAPLPALEALGEQGFLRARLVVAGHASDSRDADRARALGAKGFVVMPLDMGLVVRAVQRAQKWEPAAQTA